MKITCNNCKSTYIINEEIIPKNGGKARCKVCKNVFKIYPPNNKKKSVVPKKQPKKQSLPVIIVTEDQIKKNLLKQILNQYNISATFYDNYNSIKYVQRSEKKTTKDSANTTKIHAQKKQPQSEYFPQNRHSTKRHQFVRNAAATKMQFTSTNDDQTIKNLVSKNVNKLKGSLGLDIGSNYIVVASTNNNQVTYKNDINAFFTIPSAEVTQKTLQAHKIPFFVQNRNIFVCGYPAQDFANIFNADIRRPIEKGLINANEQDGFTVIRSIIERMVPPSKKQGEPVAFGVPGNPLDYNASVTYHESVLFQYLKSLGYHPIPVNEGFATVIAELADNAYTGIGISMGGGMCNVCLAYMAVPIISFSISKGGDYIDAQVAQSVGESPAKVKIIKQENLDLSQRATGKIQTALSIFYDNLISLLIDSFIDRIDNTRRIPNITKAIPVVISGGTAMPPGFEERFAKALTGVNFPVRISEVRIAQDPLFTTAKGTMIVSMSGGDIVPRGKETVKKNRVITFSPSTIRGNIIHKSFLFNGFHSSWHNKIYETEAAIVREKPSLLIVDTVDNFSKAVLFIKTLTQNQPHLRIVKLVESSKMNDLKRHGLSSDHCYPEVLEPEILVDEVVHMIDNINIEDMEPVSTEQPEETTRTGNMFMQSQSLPPFFKTVEQNWFHKMKDTFSNFIDDIWN